MLTCCDPAPGTRGVLSNKIINISSTGSYQLLWGFTTSSAEDLVAQAVTGSDCPCAALDPVADAASGRQSGTIDGLGLHRIGLQLSVCVRWLTA